MSELAQRLGHGPDDRPLIINCDDLGSSASASRATEAALAAGLATSATLIDFGPLRDLQRPHR